MATLFDKLFAAPAKERKNKALVKAQLSLMQQQMDTQSVIMKHINLMMGLTEKRYTSLDAGHWSSAIKQAVQEQNPNRLPLYRIYWQATQTDSHLISCLTDRRTALLQQPFRLVKADGTEDTETAARLDKMWFHDFMAHALDSKFYGYSLIELINKDDADNISLQLIPRQYVYPEYELVVTFPGNMVGIKYTDFDNMIGIGKADDLGILSSVSLDYIYRKNAIISWAVFQDKFGMPARVLKTTSKDEEWLAKMEENLDQFGEELQMIIGSDDEFIISESGKSDAYRVYDEFIKMKRDDISKAILGQTMTKDNGSSRAQAQVHLAVQTSLLNADRRFVTHVVNTQLLPKLDWVPEGTKFMYRRGEIMTSAERTAQVKTLADAGYSVNPRWLEEELSIPLSNGTPME